MTLLVTQAGLTKAIDADNQGISVKITHVAMGSEGYTPAKNMTSLKNETVRVAVGTGKQVSPNQIQLTATFDGEDEIVGREVGFFLEDGTLFAVDSHPSDVLAYKSGAKGAVSIEAFDLIFDTVPLNSITITMSGDLHEHESNENPHPQYATKAQLGVKSEMFFDVPNGHRRVTYLGEGLGHFEEVWINRPEQRIGPGSSSAFWHDFPGATFMTGHVSVDKIDVITLCEAQYDRERMRVYYGNEGGTTQSFSLIAYMTARYP